MRKTLIKLLDFVTEKFRFNAWEYTDKIADYLITNGVTVPVRCRECKHWLHTGSGWGDCTNRRFHLDGHCDPTMQAEEYCCLGERRENNA